jgi:antitoxin VapB
MAGWPQPACAPAELDAGFVDVSMRVYTFSMGGVRAKLFQNGGSQAVRLPKACRFPEGDEVLARREGRRVILEPADEWPDEFRACLGAWREEIPRPAQQPLREVRSPFA